MNDSTQHDSSAVYNVSSDTFELQAKIISATACAVNLAVGLPTNIYVLWLMATGTEAAMASGFFSLNLSLAESVGGLFALVCLLNRYAFHAYLQGVDMAFLGFMSAGRSLFQCLVCAERYLAVVRPVTYLKVQAKPLGYKAACSGLAWVSTLGVSVGCLLLNDPGVTLRVCTVIFSVLFVIKMFCLLAILWTLRRTNGPGEGQISGEMSGVKLRAFRIVLLIMAAVAINYVPLLVISAMYDSLEPRECWFASSISFSFTVITGFVNPLLYLHRVGKMSCDCWGRG